MPEGDTIYRTASTLRRALCGSIITRLETVIDPVSNLDRQFPVAGRQVAAVEARGKHLLILFRHPNAINVPTTPPASSSRGQSTTEDTEVHRGEGEPSPPAGDEAIRRRPPGLETVGSRSEQAGRAEMADALNFPPGNGDARREGQTAFESGDPVIEWEGERFDEPDPPLLDKERAGVRFPAASPFTLPHTPVRTPPSLGLELVRSDLVLHTHLRMTGSWHIYRPGEAWRKPDRLAKVVLYTADFVAPCFSAPVVELLTAREVARHRDLTTLGPDAITPEFDPVEARERIRRRPDLEISVALMDQHALAGVGNVFKSEVLFIRRVSPFTRVRDLDDATLDGLIEESHRLLRLNTERGNRRTVFHLDPKELLWVYGRIGQPCRVCGEAIKMRRQGIDARSTYYCPRCQHVGSLP